MYGRKITQEIVVAGGRELTGFVAATSFQALSRAAKRGAKLPAQRFLFLGDLKCLASWRGRLGRSQYLGRRSWMLGCLSG